MTLGHGSLETLQDLTATRAAGPVTLPPAGTGCHSAFANQGGLSLPNLDTRPFSLLWPRCAGPRIPLQPPLVPGPGSWAEEAGPPDAPPQACPEQELAEMVVPPEEHPIQAGFGRPGNPRSKLGVFRSLCLRGNEDYVGIRDPGRQRCCVTPGSKGAPFSYRRAGLGVGF